MFTCAACRLGPGTASLDLVAVAIAIVAAAPTLAGLLYLCKLYGAVWVVYLEGLLFSWSNRRRMVNAFSSPRFVADQVPCCFSDAVVRRASIKALSKRRSTFTLAEVNCVSIGCGSNALGKRCVATVGLL